MAAGTYAPFLIGLFFPFIETLLLQALPAIIAQIYIELLWQRWALVVVPFALLHVQSVAPLASLVHGFSGGFVMGYMYIRYMNESHHKAICMTWLLHATHNLIALST